VGPWLQERHACQQRLGTSAQALHTQSQLGVPYSKRCFLQKPGPQDRKALLQAGFVNDTEALYKQLGTQGYVGRWDPLLSTVPSP
jgi:hypothetical protein